MKTLIALALTATFLAPLLLSSCSTQAVGDARQSGVERRQDRIDARTSARQGRWEERAAREDARADARFNSW